jgi:predicted dehydrogenase
VKAFQALPAAEVVAVADTDAERLKVVGAELGVPGRYASVGEMLRKESLNVVSVVTPNKFHKPVAVAALEAGCHVLCEKPMAMNAAEGRAMLAAARKARRRLMINFSYRFRDDVWAMKRQVEQGLIGDVYFARTVWHRRRGIPRFGGWFGQKALSGGGPMIDLGVHRLDLALWFMGHPRPVWVMASAYDAIASRLAREQGKAFDCEDLAVGLIRFENGAMLEVEASWAANIAERELMETRLFGAKGGMVQRNTGEGYQFESEVFLDRDGVLFDMKPHAPLPAAPTAQAHFIQSILDDAPHTATGEEGLFVMEILDALYKSARTGRPVRIAASRS